jgi:rare lipoprotein A
MTKTGLTGRWPLFLLLLPMIMGVFWACAPHAPDHDHPHVPGAVPKDHTQQVYEVFGKEYMPIYSADGFREQGVASWYGHPFHGQKTSSGEIYNMHAKTAAHPTLPMGTFLLVRNLENNRETIVRINDRGPFAKDRVIDLSYRSAQKIDMIQNGTAMVELIAMDLDSPDVQERVTNAHPDYFTGDFTIQVAAYSDKNRAEALRDQLKTIEKEVFVTQASIDGQPVYRVRVGRFSSMEEAKRTKERLSQNGYENVIAVSAGQ